MKIVFLDAHTLNAVNDLSFAALQALGNLQLYPFTTVAEEAARVVDADILIVNKHKVTASLLSHAKTLKYIVVAATGYNNIDLAATAARGIPVSNVRAYSTEGVAQYVMAAMLAHYHKLAHYFQETSKGRWQQQKDFCFYDHSIQNLSAKTLGIIGFGTIGKRVASLAHAFGMRVLAHTAYPIPGDYSYTQAVALEEIFRQADVLTLHAPLNNTTKEIINAASLASMKQDALLINTGRGGLIHESSLAAHLRAHPAFTAIVDVLSAEPPADDLLTSLPNCHVTPHLAWASQQSRIQLLDGIVKLIRSFQQGTVQNVVA
ncbi:D-2-hydroxyacid dehydrogenase [Flavihumibacter profundi]|uniref:D-2-hydroxyacid dehydrogenase n=1 Tax=Flavihumibacter profundi TaxID=2716883 RepID=UPI001CC468CE|nr:D-2-hydroxyacid dehydrogenase [Flavihumibacter profundi]MBZ5857182.1 D-2-hydroxyacid dehydrogenase [Flavihumibacter profundi]